jgi:hypothetical protein
MTSVLLWDQTGSQPGAQGPIRLRKLAPVPIQRGGVELDFDPEVRMRSPFITDTGTQLTLVQLN